MSDKIKRIQRIDAVLLSRTGRTCVTRSARLPDADETFIKICDTSYPGFNYVAQLYVNGEVRIGAHYLVEVES